MAQERPAHGYVVNARAGLTSHGPGVLATRESTHAAMTVMESQIDGGPPLHVHAREDESFYVLEGTVTVRCGGDAFEAGPCGVFSRPGSRSTRPGRRRRKG